MPIAARPGLEAHVISPMPGEARFEAFFEHEPQRFVQRVGHVDRRRVVVDAVAAPVVGDQRDIEIPAPHLFACASRIFSTARSLNDTGARPGGQLEALLRAGVDGVDLPLVDFDRDAAERRHRVEDQHRARRRARPPRFPRSAATRRSKFRPSRSPRPSASRGPAPPSLRPRVNTSPHGRSIFVTSPPARSAMSASRPPNTPLTQTSTRSPGSTRFSDRRFLPGRARAADRHRHAVLGAKHLAEHRLQLVHDPQVVRIQMPDRRLARARPARADGCRSARAQAACESADSHSWN